MPRPARARPASRKAVVNVHYLAGALEAHLKNRVEGIEIAVSDEREQLLETGGGLVKALPLIDADPFLVVNSDNLWVDGPVDTLRLLAAGWDEARMDALLLLVPLARANCHSGRGDFHMSAAGRAQAPQAERRRAVRLYRHPDGLEAAVRRASCPTGPSRPTSCGTGRSPRAAASAPSTRACGSTSAAPANIAQGRGDPGGPESPRRERSRSFSVQLALAAVQLRHPSVFTIPPHRAFADALAAGLIARFGRGDDRAGAGHRAGPQQPRRAGDPGRVRAALGRRAAAAAAGAGRRSRAGRADRRRCSSRSGEGEAIPPAIEPARRLMLLARLVQRHLRRRRGRGAAPRRGSRPHARPAADRGGRSGPARRLRRRAARALAPLAEVARPAAADPRPTGRGCSPSAAGSTSPTGATGCSARSRGAGATRRRRASSARPASPPPRPPSRGCSRVVARLPRGHGRAARRSTSTCRTRNGTRSARTSPTRRRGRRRRSIETHPQFHLKLLLDRMSVGRGEVERWRWGGGRDAPAARSRAIANAMAPAALHRRNGRACSPAERRLTGVRALELADPAEEAQAIALALREALEDAGPDRRAGHARPRRSPGGSRPICSAGGSRPTTAPAGRSSQTPPGTLLLAAAAAAAERFAPVPLLALLKHPLVMAGERPARLARRRARCSTWRCAARGRRRGWTGSPPISPTASGRDGGAARARPPPGGAEVAPLLRAAGARRSRRRASLAGLARRAARGGVTALAGDAAWAGPAGRAAAELLAELEAAAGEGPERVAGRRICRLCSSG